ncbi:MAG: GAF domain-containing protein [Actinomycetales bacterium]
MTQRTPALSSPQLQRLAFRAHEQLDGLEAGSLQAVTGQLRPLVRQSWQRSLDHLRNPDAVEPAVWDDDQLDEYRRGHPLAAIMPVINQLLVRPGAQSGLLVAVGDEHGRLLWVDGDAALRRRAAGIGFAAGADWSESAVGTSAPGTALAVGRSVQIAGAEHFARVVHPWSCTAVPLHDPDSGTVLGVVDITGNGRAVGGHTLSLVEAAVAAAEAQLSVQRLRERAAAPKRAARRGPASPLYKDSLQVLGRDTAVLNLSGRTLNLSERHSEILTVLALYPDGLSAEELAAQVYGPDASVTSIRAELLRLRRLLAKYDGTLVPASRPYRLPRGLVLDATQVLHCLHRGAHRLALDIYRGPVLPRSGSPAVAGLRREVAALLREAILNDASAEVLLQYLQLPEAGDDVDAWRTALVLLPARSPRRAAVVDHLERLETDLR